MPSSTLLKVILRFGGALLCSAAVAVVLPREAMVAANAWLGLAPFPDAPLTFYLARVTSALYAVHGCVLFLASTDPVRHRPLILLLGGTNVLLGVALLGIGLSAGMPGWWTLAEGPTVIVIGLVLLGLAAPLGQVGSGSPKS